MRAILEIVRDPYNVFIVLFGAGNMNQNKIGVPEMLLHCSKCDQSSHPTCIGLSLDLIHVNISLL